MILTEIFSNFAKSLQISSEIISLRKCVERPYNIKCTQILSFCVECPDKISLAIYGSTRHKAASRLVGRTRLQSVNILSVILRCLVYTRI